ncbi:MAG: hypothetical protein V5B60_12830 [Accumulibacter sp.]|jgi:hypothetical protein
MAAAADDDQAITSGEQDFGLAFPARVTTTFEETVHAPDQS